MIIEQEIQNRINSLPQEYNDFIFGPYIEEVIRIYTEAARLSFAQRDVFENGVLLFLLSFLDENDLKEFLITQVKLGPKNAEEIVHEIVSSLPDRLREYLSNSYIFLNEAEENIVDKVPITTITNHALSTNSHTIRTMSHDMATIRPGSETVYRAASQADILNKEEPIVTVKEGVPARWESETTN